LDLNQPVEEELEENINYGDCDSDSISENSEAWLEEFFDQVDEKEVSGQPQGQTGWFRPPPFWGVTRDRPPHWPKLGWQAFFFFFNFFFFLILCFDFFIFLIFLYF
jgi:hypothetical protein